MFVNINDAFDKMKHCTCFKSVFQDVRNGEIPLMNRRSLSLLERRKGERGERR